MYKQRAFFKQKQANFQIAVNRFKPDLKYSCKWFENTKIISTFAAP